MICAMKRFPRPSHTLTMAGLAIISVCVTPGVEAAEKTVSPSSGFFESDGLRIHYESFGEGPPLVLVHGWGADTQSNWIDTGWVDALKAVRLVISLEVRGHGTSDKPHTAEAYSYSVMSHDVIALLDHLDIPKADFMGYSMGSFMGAYLLGHHADRFNSMILGGIGDETPESANACIPIAAALRAADPKEITDPLGAAYRSYVAADPDNDLEALAVSALQMWPEGYPLKLGGAGLSAVKIPVLIVNGGEDHPYADSDDALAEAIPGAQLVTIPNKNHLTAVTDPLFKQAVIEFLKQHDSKRANLSGLKHARR